MGINFHLHIIVYWTKKDNRINVVLRLVELKNKYFLNENIFYSKF